MSPKIRFSLPLPCKQSFPNFPYTIPLVGGTNASPLFPPTVFAARRTASSGVMPVLILMALKFRITLSTASSTSPCISMVAWAGSSLFAFSRACNVPSSTLSVVILLPGFLHNCSNVVSTLITSSISFS